MEIYKTSLGVDKIYSIKLFQYFSSPLPHSSAQKNAHIYGNVAAHLIKKLRNCDMCITNFLHFLYFFMLA